MGDGVLVYQLREKNVKKGVCTSIYICAHQYLLLHINLTLFISIFRCNANAPRRLHLLGATEYFLNNFAFAYFFKKNMQLHLVGAICEVHLHCTGIFPVFLIGFFGLFIY